MPGNTIAMNHLLFILLCIGLFGCVEYDPRLVAVDKQADADPNCAMAMLDSIDRTGFSERNLRYYDLLWIKTRDKAYVPHTSDSVISRVAGYYESRSRDRLYPEAMYYAGRVYGELGDFPIALDYFHEALDAVPASDLHLRGNILSQTARLLDGLRLHKQAIPYIEEALLIDSLESNIYNISYDNLLLAGIYLHLKDYNKALAFFDNAKISARLLSDEHMANMEIYEAVAYIEKGEVDSVVTRIESISERVEPSFNNLVLSCMAEAYVKSGLYEKAYESSFKLAHSEDMNNKLNGYKWLLSPQLIRFSRVDSIIAYAGRYGEMIDGYFESHSDKAILIQNAYYNYSVHERERVKAENSRNKLLVWVTGLSLLIVILVLSILLLRSRNIRKQLELSLAENKINELNGIIENIETNRLEVGLSVKEQSMESVKEKLIEALMELREASPSAVQPLLELTSSEIYNEINRKYENGDAIPDTSDIWVLLEETVLRVAPNFKKRLLLITNNKVTKAEYRTAMLTRCGFNPAKLCVLLAITKGAVSSRRDKLGEKIFGKKTNVKTVDDIIRLL